jgi:hypothetical protein
MQLVNAYILVLHLNVSIFSDHKLGSGIECKVLQNGIILSGAQVDTAINIVKIFGNVSIGKRFDDKKPKLGRSKKLGR